MWNKDSDSLVLDQGYLLKSVVCSLQSRCSPRSVIDAWGGGPDALGLQCCCATLARME